MTLYEFNLSRLDGDPIALKSMAALGARMLFSGLTTVAYAPTPSETSQRSAAVLANVDPERPRGSRLLCLKMHRALAESVRMYASLDAIEARLQHRPFDVDVCFEIT